MSTIQLARAYTRFGTVGVITGMGLHLEMVELPWRSNQVNRSCIPEGVYRYKRHHAPTLDTTTLWLPDVPGRSEILWHPAGGIHQLDGCGAPAKQYAFDIDVGGFITEGSWEATEELLDAAGNEGEIEIYTWRPEYP